jgi:ketosteroid isomerase-like protein
MNDEEGIRRTIAEYCQLVDDGNFDEWIGLYVEDAVHESGGRVYRGRAAIEEFIRSIPLADLKHFTANSVIEVDGDSAYARTDWIAFRAGGDGFGVAECGRYHDRFVKHDRRWFFAQRRNVRWKTS